MITVTIAEQGVFQSKAEMKAKWGDSIAIPHGAVLGDEVYGCLSGTHDAGCGCCSDNYDYLGFDFPLPWAILKIEVLP